jgi:hypothetical protein
MTDRLSSRAEPGGIGEAELRSCGIYSLTLVEFAHFVRGIYRNLASPELIGISGEAKS